MEWEWMEPGPSDGFDPLSVWMQMWVEGFVSFLGVILVVVLVALAAAAVLGSWGTGSVRRRFWCRRAGRNVEVEFATRGLVPRIASVTWCSAFEPGSAISCSRRCLNASFRRYWPPALPVATRGRRAA